MGCKDTIVLVPLMESLSVKCLTYEQSPRKPYNDILCIFRGLALHVHGNERLSSETSRLFNLFFEKTGKTDRTVFGDVCMEDIAIVKDIVQVDIFSCDIDIVDGSTIGSLRGRVWGNTIILYGSYVMIVTFAMSHYQRSLRSL